MTTEKTIDFPPLPEPRWVMAPRQHDEKGIPWAFTAKQMHDYVAADRAQRQAGQEPAKPNVEIELPDGDGRDVKIWWSEWRGDAFVVSIQIIEAPPPAQVPEGWISVAERLPELGKPVLIAMNGKVLRAVHAPEFALSTEDYGDFEPDGGEFDPATEKTYWPEGWYEWNNFEETHWAVDFEPTHWMPLPAAPK